MGRTEGARVEKQPGKSFEQPEKSFEQPGKSFEQAGKSFEQAGKSFEEQPGKSWVVLEERNQGSIGLPLLLTVAKIRDG